MTDLFKEGSVARYALSVVVGLAVFFTLGALSIATSLDRFVLALVPTLAVAGLFKGINVLRWFALGVVSSAVYYGATILDFPPASRAFAALLAFAVLWFLTRNSAHVNKEEM